MDVKAGKFEIFNKYDFTDLSQFEIHWVIYENGKPVANGLVANQQVPPHKSKIITVVYPSINLLAGSEYFITFSFKTKGVGELITKGFEVAWDQFQLPWEKKDVVKPDISSLPKLILKNNTTDKPAIVGNNFQITFDAKTGQLKSFVYDTSEYIASIPVPDFWRAATDNDMGNKMPLRCGVWRYAFDDALLDSFGTKLNNPGEVEVKTVFKLPSIASKYFVTYSIFGNGEVIIRNRFVPGKEGLPEIPRVGMKFGIPGRFENITWYGRGPQENYQDRNSGAMIAVHSRNVSEFFFPYVRPQECGNLTGVRWISLKDNLGNGFIAAGMPELSVSALNVNTSDLNWSPRTRHACEVRKSNYITLHLDYKQMGVGGDNSWGAPVHPEYAIPAKEYSYIIRFKPFSRNEGQEEKLLQNMY